MNATSRDIEMLRHPALWPMRPILPLKNVKRRDEQGFPELGVIFEGNETTVLIGCVGITDFTKSTRETFPNIGAMLDAGWVVD